MVFLNRIISIIMSLFILLSSFFSNGFTGNEYEFNVDAASLGKAAPNLASTVNVWSIEGNPFVNPTINVENNVFQFVEYVELMQCSGGSEGRDLFLDPLDRAVLDDYNFTHLIENCRGIITLGAKPFLKLGNVPLKYSQNATVDTEYNVNPYPPDDYNVYYNYIKALITALADEFGVNEVRSWRFGVMTEYENQSWFKADDNKEDLDKRTAIEYCKLYDYTVEAIIDVLGEDIFVGAHSMTVTDGLWDEAYFIEHCAKGTNYKTGEKGTKISYLSASFYDEMPGVYAKEKTLPETIKYLRKAANKAGLKDLIFGIDEGRILKGTTSGTDSNELHTRSVGYLYQAAYDARMYTQMLENDIDYFSYWSYLSGGLLSGNPTVSYHVSKNISAIEGAKLTKTSKTNYPLFSKSDVKAIAAFNEDTSTLYVMAYNFNNSLNYSKDAKLKINLSVPQFAGREVKIVSRTIDNDCNYFDEWQEDRKTYGIDDSCFSWSPDDPNLDNETTLKDERAREIYFNELYEKYKQCSQLVPKTENKLFSGDSLTIENNLAPHSVVFYEITLAQ